MIINRELCIGCETCVPHCPFGAISVTEGVASINEDSCVECRAQSGPSSAMSLREPPTRVLVEEERRK
jgi:ferredoxin